MRDENYLLQQIIIQIRGKKTWKIPYWIIRKNGITVVIANISVKNINSYYDYQSNMSCHLNKIGIAILVLYEWLAEFLQSLWWYTLENETLEWAEI